MASKCSVCTKSVYPNDPKIVLDGCTVSFRRRLISGFEII